MKEILYVDDDPEDRELFGAALSLVDIRAEFAEASSAHDAIAQLEQASELPKVIVTDINMPKMNGFELVRYLKANDKYRNIPVIVFSNANNFFRGQTFKMGIHDYIVKPQTFEDLKIAVTRILAGIKSIGA